MYTNIPEISAMADRNVHPKIIKILSDKPKGKVLDIGAGQGALSQLLFKNGFDVNAIDINKENFKLHNKVKFYQRNINEELNINEKYDIVCAVEIIEHIENPYKLIRDCYNLLENSGTLIISTPNVTSFKSRLTNLFFGRPNSFFPSDRVNSGHINPIPIWELIDILKNNSFEIETIEPTKLDLQVTPKYSLKSLILKILYITGLILTPLMREWKFDTNKTLLFGNVVIVKATKK